MIIFKLLLTITMVQVGTQHSINPRIMNGESAPPNKYPFIAFIESGVPIVLPYHYECAGVVYDEYHILTTAACIKEATSANKARVKIGMHFTRKDAIDVQIMQIDYTIIHENFTSFRGFWINDIGLIVLKNAISNPVISVLSERVSPTGAVWIAGWGSTSLDIFSGLPKVLQHASLEIMKRDACRVHFQPKKSSYLDDSHICIYTPRNITTALDTDIGGPVMQYVNGKIEVIGLISSMVFPYTQKGLPTVTTNVTHFLSWIAEKIYKTPNEDLIEDLEAPLLVTRQ